MECDRLRVGRLYIGLCVFLFLAPLTVAPHATAKEPASDFLKRLRAAGYHDTAERYLERLDEYPGIDDGFRSAVELERAQLAIDAALATRGPAARDERFSQAEDRLRAFLENKGHPRAPEARLLLGTIQMGRARQLMLGDADEEQRAAARESYLAASTTFEGMIVQLRGKLSEMQGARIDAEKEPQKAALRDQYRSEFLNALLNSATANYWAAMTFADPAEDGRQQLEQALAQFTSLHDEYSKYVQGAKAMLFRGKIQQALGQDAAALDSYLRMLEQRDADPIREAKFEAANGMIEIWLVEQPPRYASAIDRGQAMISSLRPNEKNLPVTQQLRVNLAQAYLAKAEDKEAHNSTERGGATANARQLLNEARRIPGDHLGRTQELLATLGIEPAEAALPTADATKTIDEALDATRQILESLGTLDQSLELLRKQVDATAETTEQIAEIEAERDRLLATGVLILRRGLTLVNAGTDRDTVNQTRQWLAHLLYQQGRYREAAVVGSFIARTSPGTESGLRHGLLALNSLQLLISESGEAVGSGLVPHLQRLGTYLASTWPNSPEAAGARGVMVQLALRNDRWDEADRLIDEMPAGPEQAHFQRLLGQLTWNRSLAARRDGDEAEADRLLDAAVNSLTSGLHGIGGKAVGPDAMQAALILAKAQLRQNDSQAALKTLDHADYGPTRLVGKVEAPYESFPTDLYSAELQAVVGQMTASDSDAAILLARAEQTMQKLRDSVTGKDAQGKLLGILIRLARDIREQIDSAAPNQQQKLVDAFRLFVDRIAESSSDPATLQWVGNTLLQMGESLTAAESKPQGQAAALIASASKAFQELIGDKDNPSLTVRYQLARSYRLLGEYKRAIDELALILSENPNMLDAQIEAALAYEKWAAELGPPFTARAYQSALVGARPDASGNNVIWGWGKISQMANRDPKFRDKFFDARYHVALCRFLMGRAMNDTKVLDKAITDITSVSALYPELGGPDQKQKFDVLLKQIQREVGKTPTGLPAPG